MKKWLEIQEGKVDPDDPKVKRFLDLLKLSSLAYSHNLKCPFCIITAVYLSKASVSCKDCKACPLGEYTPCEQLGKAMLSLWKAGYGAFVPNWQDIFDRYVKAEEGLEETDHNLYWYPNSQGWTKRSPTLLVLTALKERIFPEDVSFKWTGIKVTVSIWKVRVNVSVKDGFLYIEKWESEGRSYVSIR